ncbi:hypothetical protein MANES_14G077400v8 [Manihot esculenta]|uniref:Uncharacterized protein n=1 Tax=Manihot esculenta TaxID=3983 RepID=A0ACB7GFX3_MANES|nr:hypothetical protein MANES_14G077400v8 [Manihot esculenta]
MDGESKSTDLPDLRDASFAYLTAVQQNYVLKLTETAEFPTPDIISTQETSIQKNSEKTKPGEGEITVFGAEEYFNMKLDDESAGNTDANGGKYPHEKIENGDELHLSRPKSSRKKRVNGRWFFPGFACNGSCFHGKSVYLDKSIPHGDLQVAGDPIMLEGAKQSRSRLPVKDEFRRPSLEKTSTGSNGEDCLVLSTVNSAVQNLVVKGQKQKSLEEDPRKSLDVFGSHMVKREDIVSNLERKLSVLTWDAIPFPKARNLPTTSASSQVYEEAESDASSDLFEIENISCSTQPPFRKQTSDGLSGCMTPPSRYEPSETSIEWSVVTASAADFSAVSDYHEKKPAEISIKSAGLTSSPRTRRPKSLLGCTNEKAIEVAESAYKRNEKTKPHLHHQTSMPVTRKLPADSKVKDFAFP